ncbi:MAG: phage head closure protein [Syntrophomonas sp.]|nr:phage head closure protein [Syntrophomonas sp.]
MGIGDMRHRITFLKITHSINENGFGSEVMEEYMTVWAAVNNLTGKEFFAAAQVNAENTVKFTIRYLAGLDQSMKIIFQGKTYNITAIDNIKYQNRYMEIKAMEVDADGQD